MSASPLIAARRDSAAGLALAAMLALTVLAARGLAPLWLAGLLAWFAGLLLWPRARRAQKLQFALLAGVGLGCMLLALWLGEPVSPARILSQNQGLLGMLAAVSFLRLVAAPARGAVDSAPQGMPSFLKTLFGLHAFGSVINLSALVIIGDRLAARGPLDRTSAVLLSRGFASAAFWSPFFAAMAVALTYAPGARVTWLLLAGLPLAALALGFTTWRLRRLSDDRLAGFSGYPLRLESLWLPALLAVLVMLAHELLPGWQVLTLVTLLAPALTLAALLARNGLRDSGRILAGHIGTGLPAMHGELLLFLAAGVLGAGLLGLGNAVRDSFSAVPVNALSLSLAVVLMNLAAVLGVHPVVSIVAAAAVFGPLSDPTPVAFAYLAAWGIGAAASPLSGMHLLMQGRYGISGYSMMRWNLPYTLVMTLAAVGGIVLILTIL